MENFPDREEEFIEDETRPPHRIEDDLVNAIGDIARDDKNRADLYAEWVSAWAAQGINEIEVHLRKQAAFLIFLEAQDNQPESEQN